MDLVSLLLVAGSAVSVVVLGLLIDHGVRSPKKTVVAESPKEAPLASPTLPYVSPDPKPLEEKKKEAPRPQAIVAPVLVEPLVDVSEAPPPFSEDPIVPKRRKTVRSFLPTDTTALNAFSSETAASRMLVISAPKKKVRAYRNATSAVGSPPRKRRSPARNISVPPVSGVLKDPKITTTDSVSNSISS